MTVAYSSRHPTDRGASDGLARLAAPRTATALRCPSRLARSGARQAGQRSVRQTRIIVTHYGGPDALRVVEEECPEPGPAEVRVRVLAAGVSLPDLMMREGLHPETPRLPFTPGWDLVGVVDRLGDAISGIEPGQLVAALPITGAYAEFVCLPPRELVPVPSGKGDLPFAFDIAMGVKRGNEPLRKRLQTVLDRRQAEIAKILKEYGVPLLERKVNARP